MFKVLLLSLAAVTAIMAQPPTCLDARNFPVTIREAPIADFGHASLDKNGRPVIVPNGSFMKGLPAVVGKFVFEAVGESRCSQEAYRVILETARTNAGYERSSHSWIVPPDLR